jgi:hypothetical protein
MSEESNFTIRLSKAAKEFNMGKEAIAKFLAKNGFQIDSAPNTKLTADMYELLAKEFQGEKEIKNEAEKLGNISYRGGSVSIESDSYTSAVANPTKEGIKEIKKRRKQKGKVHKLKKNDGLDKQKEERKEKKEKTIEEKIELKIPFSELEFGQGLVSLAYKERRYVYANSNIINYDTSLNLIYNKVHESTKSKIKAFLIWVVIDIKSGTFSFKDIDICKYVNNLIKSYRPMKKKSELGNETLSNNKKKQELVTEPSNEQHNKEIRVYSLRHLNFGANNISIKLKPFEFVLWETGISPYLNFEKSIKNISTKILLDYSDLTFQFLDLSILSKLKDLSAKLEKVKRKEEKEKTVEKKIQLEILFSNLKFGQGLISITYKGKCYIYKDPKIRNYDQILNQVYSKLSKTRRRPIKSTIVKVVIDTETETFTFNDIDICNYVNYLMNSFLTEKQVEALNENPLKSKSVPQMPSSVLKTITLESGNIHFYNGYYLIFQTNNGEIDNSVAPYRVNDPNSHEILNLVHKYFEQIFEQKRIIVKIDKTKIIEPSRLDLFQLSNYVRELKRNLDEKDVWWEEVQNARKRSFVQCCGEPTESVKKRVAKSKNEYLYNLSSLQNEKKLIRVYEINRGNEEDAFIFTISMSNNRCAIVFENASKDTSTTTWIFVAKDEDYEPCINLVFDYFTDYTISLKRSSLRSTINPPEKFKAESYAFIYHDDIGQWLKKLNKILGQTPEPSEIQFVPGLHIPESSETRTGHGDTITTKHLHNQLMHKLYDKLCGENGKDNVGTEIRVGTKRIDTVVKRKEFFDIYEIKTATNPFDCVTEALGQLCQYAYLYCPDKIGKLVIVGPSETTKEVEQYLSTLRKNHSLQLYYLKV